MEPAGLGALFLAFQQLKARLEAEGLFDPALKRLYRLRSDCSGDIANRAAVRDIITVARRRWPAVHIVNIPTQEAIGPRPALCPLLNRPTPRASGDTYR